MDKKLFEQKLDNLLRCLGRIEEKRPASQAELGNDLDRQDIIALNLERAVQACVDMAAMIISDSNHPFPKTMADSFKVLHQLRIIDDELSLRMQKAVGFRNIMVHDYVRIDWNIVWAIISKNLSDFRSFSKQVAIHIGFPTR